MPTPEIKPGAITPLSVESDHLESLAETLLKLEAETEAKAELAPPSSSPDAPLI